MALPTAAELRAVFGKDAFRLVARSRLELPRSGKQYKQLKFTSPCFSFDDFGVAELMEVHKSRETGKEQADAARGRSLANPKTAKGVAIAAKSPKAAGASVLSARDEVSEVTTAPKPRTPIVQSPKGGSGDGFNQANAELATLLSCLAEGPTVGTSETQVTQQLAAASEGEAKSSDANSVMPLQAASVTEHHHDDAVVTAVMSTSAPPPDPTFEADFMYKGECEGDTPNGSGTIATPLGVYEGDVLEGVPHGLGVFTCATVARYEGEWVGGYRDGHGQMIYSDQTIYRGQWKRGYKHGFGLEVDAMGTLRRGRWEWGSLVERDLSTGNMVGVQQLQALQAVKPYERGLKPMPRFALSNPVLPQNPGAVATKRTAAVIPAAHTARFDAQLARNIAVLRAAGVDQDFRTPRTIASESAARLQLKFYNAKKDSAFRAMEDHIRFTGVFGMLREGMQDLVPRYEQHKIVSQNRLDVLNGVKTLAEIKVQKLNKLVSSTDRGRMTVNGLGLPMQYRDRPVSP